jgi:ubiquinone/menaquinone biosynthesis C-methylase UbiE
MIYSIENAKKFQWSSISGNLNPERVLHLTKYLMGKKILDAGCGGGAYVEFLSQKGLEVTGIDKYDEFLQVARERGRQGTYIQGDITNLPFPDKTFDCTYCFDVLEHVDDQRAILELIRVTKNRLILAVPKEDEIMNSFNLTFLHYQDKTHLRNYTEKSLETLLAKNSCFDINIFPELAIHAPDLVREMISSQKSTNNLFSKVFYEKLFYRFLIKILRKASYKQIYTGLVTVINL